jgi:hypothetical protein
MNGSYSRVCDHYRLKRINNNFVRCIDCGESMISQTTITNNKSSKDFSKENPSFARNFDRNFTNILEEIDNEYQEPIIEYYTDGLHVNKIIVERRRIFQTNPAKYAVKINGNKYYLTNDEIKKVLTDIQAIRINI